LLRPMGCWQPVRVITARAKTRSFVSMAVTRIYGDSERQSIQIWIPRTGHPFSEIASFFRLLMLRAVSINPV